MKPRKKITTVREHPLHVPISTKNPKGITIRDSHLRRLPGTYLDIVEIKNIFANYDRKIAIYPTKSRLPQYKNADSYDDLIAVWTDYFNKKFTSDSPLDPDVVKALIAIPLGIRWLHRKKTTAKSKLGREPSHEEIILEYKGMLMSKTKLKEKALANYKERYNELKAR